jgi:hypothetical protein
VPRFYFDFYDDDGTGTDEVGEDFPSVEDARKEAMAAIGEAARDFSRNEDRLTIRVRDSSGQVLEVSATFEVKFAR